MGEIHAVWRFIPGRATKRVQEFNDSWVIRFRIRRVSQVVAALATYPSVLSASGRSGSGVDERAIADV
jgi:hypothetical protein